MLYSPAGFKKSTKPILNKREAMKISAFCRMLPRAFYDRFIDLGATKDLPKSTARDQANSLR